jgi:hypothetical protein
MAPLVIGYSNNLEGGVSPRVRNLDSGYCTCHLSCCGETAVFIYKKCVALKNFPNIQSLQRIFKIRKKLRKR